MQDQVRYAVVVQCHFGEGFRKGQAAGQAVVAIISITAGLGFKEPTIELLVGHARMVLVVPVRGIIVVGFEGTCSCCDCAGT